MTKQPSVLHPRTFADGLRIAITFVAGMTANEFAAKAGIGRSTLTTYLSGQRVPTALDLRRMVRVLAEAGAVDPDQLWVELGRLLDAEPSDS